MQHDDGPYLGHMEDLARKVMARTDGLTRAAFDADENLRLALTHLLQTIGEAASRVSRDYRTAHPELPWAAIIGMRHRVVHDYMSVDEEVVWRTATQEMAPPLAAFQRLRG
jgi:uncharacterized protein with HEPN domain